MAYSHNYQTSARRHFKTAEALYTLDTAGAQPGAKAVAGYLFGLAGELAVKQMMHQSGMRPLASDQRRNDPYYKHFPELKTCLMDSITGRRAGVLRQIAQDPRLFSAWNTDMRYAPTSEIKIEDVNNWMSGAKNLIDLMEAY